MYFAKTIQCLVFTRFVTLSASSSNISSRARAAKHLFTVDRSRAIFWANQYGALLFSKDSGSILDPDLSSASVQSNKFHLFGHLVQQCAIPSNNVG